MALVELVQDTDVVEAVSTVAALRLYTPGFGVQYVRVHTHYADSKPAQGLYEPMLGDVTSADNEGTVIVGAGGLRWRFVGAPTVETYGAYRDGVTPDANAFKRCILFEDKVLMLAGTYNIEQPLQPQRSHQIFQGAGKGAGGTVLITRNGGNIFEYQLTYREGVHYRDFKLMSSTPGTGKGFYSPSSIYMANPTFSNLNFDASLAFGIDANLVLAAGRDCWFGLEGTRGASHQHIRASGQSLVGSNLTTNANYWENCRFYRSNSAYGIDVVNGYMWHFHDCYWETNINSAGPVRIAGILGAYFTGCGWERNTGLAPIKVQMDSSGVTQGVMVLAVHKCQIKLDDASNTCAVVSDTANFNLSVKDCTGTAFSGLPFFKIGATSNPLANLKGWSDNYLVGFSLFPQNIEWMPELRTNAVEFDDIVTGARLGKITANTTRLIISHNTGVTIQDSLGTVYAEIVITATGVQFRARSQDGSTMWKLQPPTSGTTPTAAQWTVV